MTTRYSKLPYTDDDDRRILRDGERLVVGLTFMDSKPQQGEAKMTDSDTVLIDGAVMSKDAAIEHLQGKLAATEALRSGAVLADDVSGPFALGRQMVAQDRQRKADTTTGYGEYVQRLSNAWKSGGAKA